SSKPTATPPPCSTTPSKPPSAAWAPTSGTNSAPASATPRKPQPAPPSKPNGAPNPPRLGVLPGRRVEADPFPDQIGALARSAGRRGPAQSRPPTRVQMRPARRREQPIHRHVPRLGRRVLQERRRRLVGEVRPRRDDLVPFGRARGEEV